MTFMLNKQSISTFVSLGAAVLAAVVMAACGGGGGSPGTTGNNNGSTSGGSTVVTPTMTLDLFDATGVSKTSVTPASPLTARATVKDATGTPIANTIVTFATGDTLTTLTPSSGTALTNSSGVATVTMSAKDLATAQTEAGAADKISAAATIGTQALTAETAYSMGATAITLNLVAPNPGTINLNAYDTTPIKVDVFANGNLYTAQPVTVNFASACAGGKADLPASTTTINGRAQVVYRDKGCSMTDTVTASVAGAQSVTASLVIAPPTAASIGFVSATPSDKAIVIQGAGGNGRTETAILTFQALDTFGQPLPNQLVTFSLNATQPVTLQSASATTGSDGKVTVAVNSGTLPTTFRVIASLATGQSTISDTIAVTTGQPVQAAFSLSAGSFNISGWNHDNVTTNVNILIADQFGNPVADGTPVVFQTDSGAIGSSSIGGCVTVNGGCSVNFRSQNPRYGVGNSAGKVPGLATITVSTTSALYTLNGSIGIYLSGDAPVAPSGVTPLTTALCGIYSLSLTPKDVNGNPLPEGTTLASANISGTTTIGSIIPAAVPNTSVAIAHTIPVTPGPACVVGGTHQVTDTFDIVVTSPLGIPTLYHYSFTYPIP